MRYEATQQAARMFRDFSGIEPTRAGPVSGTIRLQLFKIGAHIWLSVRRFLIAFSESYPYTDVFRQILQGLQRTPLLCQLTTCSRVRECTGSTRGEAALARSLRRRCQSAAQRIKGAYPLPHWHKLHPPADGPPGPCPRLGYNSCCGQRSEKCGLGPRRNSPRRTGDKTANFWPFRVKSEIYMMFVRGLVGVVCIHRKIHGI